MIFKSYVNSKFTMHTRKNTRYRTAIGAVSALRVKVRQASIIYRIKSSLTKAARLQRFAYALWRAKCFRFWDRAGMGRTIVDIIDISYNRIRQEPLQPQGAGSI